MHTCKTMERLKHWLLLAMCMHGLYAVIWSCTGEALARLTTTLSISTVLYRNGLFFLRSKGSIHR